MEFFQKTSTHPQTGGKIVTTSNICEMPEQEDYSSLVDPFWGHGAVQSLETVGMARGWNWLKAQTGKRAGARRKGELGDAECPHVILCSARGNLEKILCKLYILP